MDDQVSSAAQRDGEERRERKERKERRGRRGGNVCFIC
jgi:hypothetical protein